MKNDSNNFLIPVIPNDKCVWNIQISGVQVCKTCTEGERIR